ncbi:MAG: GNAT family N-acetyltransferase [Hyphomicrobiales bacterium]|nr:GNAT family N-acetyltransferase [Hyphomicrobiales bacterium]
MPELQLDGITDLPPGKIAAVVTYLDMRSPPPQAERPPRPELTLRPVPAPTLAWYRDLYLRIGRDFLWFSRMQMSDAAAVEIIGDADVEIHALVHDGSDIGLLELDRRIAGEVEIAFFGLVPEAIGIGAGRWLMDRALELAWSGTPERVWLHTCTLDHPDALAFYLRSGFLPYKLAIEVADDPRLNGALPSDAASQVPKI